jgi:hypothetical protein
MSLAISLCLADANYYGNGVDQAKGKAGGIAAPHP